MAVFSVQGDGEDTASVLRRVLNRDRSATEDTPTGTAQTPLILSPDWRVDTPDPSAPRESGQVANSGAGSEALTLTRPEHRMVTQDAKQGAPDTSLVASIPAQSVSAVTEDVVDVIDEAMLQDLVGQFVRRELQGELGEKITHNIRKLVRAELAREMRLRDLSDHSSNG